MHFFWKPYTSDTTQMIQSLREKDPTLAQRQVEGRGLLWDRQLDRQALAEFADATVAQQPYVYQTKD